MNIEDKFIYFNKLRVEYGIPPLSFTITSEKVIDDLLSYYKKNIKKAPNK